MPLLDWVY